MKIIVGAVNQGTKSVDERFIALYCRNFEAESDTSCKG